RAVPTCQIIRIIRAACTKNTPCLGYDGNCVTWLRNKAGSAAAPVARSWFQWFRTLPRSLSDPAFNTSKPIAKVGHEDHSGCRPDVADACPVRASRGPEEAGRSLAQELDI